MTAIEINAIYERAYRIANIWSYISRKPEVSVLYEGFAEQAVNLATEIMGICRGQLDQIEGVREDFFGKAPSDMERWGSQREPHGN